MINLLPPQEKHRLVQEEIQRMIIIWGFIVAVFFAAFVLTLLLTEMQLKGRADAQEILLTSLREQLKSSHVAELKKELAAANRTLSKVESVLSGEQRVSRIFGLLTDNLPSGVYISRVSYTDAQKLISVEGFSPTRQDLLTLKQNLEGQALFSEVDFPPSNWIKAEDIHFTVNLTVNNDN